MQQAKDMFAAVKNCPTLKFIVYCSGMLTPHLKHLKAPMNWKYEMEQQIAALPGVDHYFLQPSGESLFLIYLIIQLMLVI